MDDEKPTDLSPPASPAQHGAFDADHYETSGGRTRSNWTNNESNTLEEIIGQAQRPVDWSAAASALAARCPRTPSWTATQCKTRYWNGRESSEV